MLALANKLTTSTQPIYRFVNKYSIDFDGVDDRIVTDGADTVAQPTTYSFWCKSSTTGQNKGVFGHGADKQGGFHFNASSGMPLLYLNSSCFRYWVANDEQDDGEWHHWVVYSDTNDITNSKLYVDGVLQTVNSTVLTTSPLAYTESLTIGSDQQVGGNSFEGQIDEFAVYDRELTQAEITRMYNTYYSPNRVANGNFSQIGSEEVTNGDFSQIGSEEVDNGDFSNGGTNWVNIDNKATFQNSSVIFSNDAKIYQTVSIDLTKIYKAVIDFSSISGDGIKILFGGGNSFINYSVSDIVNNNNQIVAYSNFAASGIFFVYSQSANTNATITNVSVKEVGQDWTFGTGWGMGDNVVICDGTNTSLSEVAQSYVTTVGKQYKITFKVNAVNNPIELKGSGVYTRVDTLGVGTHTIYVTADANYIRFLAFVGSTATIESLSVKEVGQHWTVGNSDADNYVVFNGSTARLKFLNTSPITTLDASFVMLAGKTYKLIVDVASVTSGSIKIDAVGMSEVFDTAGVTTRTLQPTGNSALSFYRASADVDLTLNSVILQELKHDATNLMLNAGAYQSANPLITSTKSMEFDGSDDYLSIGSDCPTGNFTVTSWVKKTGTGGWYAIFSAGTEIWFGLNNNGQILAHVGGPNFSTTGAVDINKWHNCTLTWNGTASFIYVDGVQVATSTGTSNPAATPYDIGKISTSNQNYFDGLITEVGLYDRALTSLEVASLYNQGMPTDLLVNRNNYQSGNPTVFNTKQVDFDGSDDFMQIRPLGLTGTYTYSFWYLGSPDGSFLFGETGNSVKIGFLSNKIFVRVTSDSDNTINKPDGTQWNHLVLTRNSSNKIDLYVNGGSANRLFSDSVQSSTSNFDLIGKTSSAGQNYNGQISQIGVWNSTLTADEVSSLYNHGLPIDLTTDQAAYESSSNLVGYWRMGSSTLDSYPLIADQTNATLTDIYASDFSSGVDGWNAFGLGDAAGNISIGGEDNSLRYTVTTPVGDTRAFLKSSTKTIGKTYKVTFSYYIPSTNPNLNAVYLDETDIRNSVLDTWTTVTEYFIASSVDTKIIVGDADMYLNPAATGETAYIKDVLIKQVNGNPAIMTNQTSSDIENGSPYANLVQNGDFSEGTTDWTSGTAVTSFTVTNSIATVLGTASSAQNKIQQSIPVTIGNTYKISGSIRSNDSKDYRIRILDSAYVDIKNNNNSSFETFEYERVAQSSTITLIFESWYSDGTANFSVDYATISEVNTGLQGYWKMGDGTNDEYPVIYDQTNPTNGSELVTNGDFSTDSDWTKGTGWTISGGSANCDGTQSGNSTIVTSNSISGIQNKVVKFSFELSNCTSGTISATIQGTGGQDFSSVSENKMYVIYVVSVNPSALITFTANSDFIGSIDNVSIKVVQGNPATMTNMVEGNITNQYPLTKIRNYYRMGDGILDGYPIIQDQTSPNLAHIPTTNLIPFSEDFNGSVGSFSYSKVSDTTVTPNSIIAPDGTNTGTLVTKGTNDLVIRANNVVETNKTYTFSCYVKSSGSGITNISIDITDDNLTTFTLTNDWQRISVTAEVTRTPQSTFNFVDMAANGSQNDTFYTWGWQVEEQSQATAYIKSDGIAAVRKATTTNLITYSEDFTESGYGWNYASNALELTESNSIISPDGTQSADKISKTAVRVYAYAFRAETIISGQPYSWSMFMKKGTHDIGYLSLGQGDTNYEAYFDLTNGTSGMFTGSANTNIEDVGNGWFRCSLQGVFSTTDVSVRFNFGMSYSTSNPYWPSASEGAGLYAYFWGAQLEEQTQAETYAKTTGLPVTIDLYTENNYGTMTNMSASDIVEDTPNN